MRPAGERLFDTAMLIAKGDFKMESFLARALETEVARLDDAGMDGSNSHFVNLTSINTEKPAVGGRVALGAPYRFEPRMTLWC
jgi:hypothetical protein